MLVKGVFFLFIEVTCAYNIDVDFPLVWYGGVATKSNSYFGYTVHLYHDRVYDKSWLIIGAPRGNYSEDPNAKQIKKLLDVVEPGIVYRCSIENANCNEIKPENLENEEDYIHQIAMKMLIRKQRGWFGSAISIDRSTGMLTVCAPRTIVAIINAYNSTAAFDTMQGMCYQGKVLSNTLAIEDRNLMFYDFNPSFWFNPMHGFSVRYASRKTGENRKKGEITRIIGEPKHESHGTVDILYSNKRMSVTWPLTDDLSQFGYSTESGYFFKKNQLLFVSGAPGWNYVGLVGIIDPEAKEPIVAKLQGSSVGEFFGASLAVGDLNNDGLDDLLVGAPYWGEDNGRVYIYLGTFKGQFEAAAILQGIVEGSHFGYAIASGDLDADGYDDIIVGAPWEGDGVVYIYNGGSDLKDTNLQISQRIDTASFSKLNTGRKIKRFGFSISKPIDIDRNGYLDIAIGAYKSEHALVLRSRPIMKTKLVIGTVPDILQRDARQFLLNICPSYTRSKNQYIPLLRIMVTIDEQYKRTEKTVLILKTSPQLNNCLSTQVNLSSNIQDFIEPISIIARHDFVYDNASSQFCKFCPVKERDNKLQVAQTLLSFNISCGEDKVCNSNISIAAKFHNVRDNSTWVVGSGDISLEVNLKNYGEPAYLTTVEFAIPKGVVLRSILPSCREEISKDNLIVICDSGNPIWEEEEKNVKLDLNIKHVINDSLDDNILHFRVTIKSRSTNVGMTSIVKTLNIVNEVSLSLHGKSNEEAYYLTTINEAVPNISFQHTYQVYKLGASPIEDAQLTVRVPLTFENSKTLLHMYKPRLYISGKLFECSSENTLLDAQQEEVLQLEPSSDQFNMSIFSNGMHESKKHTIEKREADEYLWFYDVEDLPAPQTLNESWSTNIIYMNCSTPDVNCTTIVCDLNALKTLQDIGKLVVKFLLDVDKLRDNFKNNKTILKFSTEASVEIIKPDARVHVNGTRSMIEIATMFYDSPKLEKLQLWIIIVSVLFGLLLLLIFAIILRTMGFFKRKGKQAITDSKSDEVTENEALTTIKPEDT
ncbi:unnamed protein product [Xylocopa violacea]|uniref:Uncharacterized protein n=1 Tax=Xylocopa violacea TaxID=135666 RepID=A0ABP1NZM0_XYLVO